MGCRARREVEGAPARKAAAMRSALPAGLRQGRKRRREPYAVTQAREIRCSGSRRRRARRHDRAGASPGAGPPAAPAGAGRPEPRSAGRTGAPSPRAQPETARESAAPHERPKPRALARDHRISPPGEVDVVVVVVAASAALRRCRLEAGLAPAPAVHHDERGERSVARRRQRHVHVERHAVEARHALGVARRGAEQRAVLRRAGMPEGLGWGGLRGGRDGELLSRTPPARSASSWDGHPSYRPSAVRGC